jgi:hypothetical protein
MKFMAPASEKELHVLNASDILYVQCIETLLSLNCKVLFFETRHGNAAFYKAALTLSKVLGFR